MASRLVNRVLIMQQGRVVRDGRPEALLPQIGGTDLTTARAHKEGKPMWFDGTVRRRRQPVYSRRRIERLQQAHRGRHGPLLIVLAVAVAAFIVWASVFQIDEVARARGEVVTGIRVQVIQSVDGGVLNELLVHEGDRVAPGQVLARLDQTRFAATVGEINARLFALKAKVARLRAEVVGREKLTFPDGLEEQAPEITQVERALVRAAPHGSVRRTEHAASGGGSRDAGAGARAGPLRERRLQRLGAAAGRTRASTKPRPRWSTGATVSSRTRAWS